MTVSKVVHLDADSRVILPEEARDALGVKPGGRLLLVIEENSVYLLPEPENWADYMYGLGKEIWEKWGGGEQYLAEERASWE